MSQRRRLWQLLFLASFKKSLVGRTHLHGPGRARRYTQLTQAAFFLIKNHIHIRALNRQRAGGAHSRAGPAICAFFMVTFNFLGGLFDLHALGLEKLYTFAKILFGAGKFKRHDAFFARQNGRIENIENQVVVFGQMINNWFMDLGFGKAKNKNF